MGSLSTLAPLLPMICARAAAAAATMPVPNDPSRMMSLSGAIAPHATAYCALCRECVHENRHRHTEVRVCTELTNVVIERTHRLMTSDASITTYGTACAAAVSVSVVKPREAYMQNV